MGEELLPGLVKVIEERMGRMGRLFTTLIIFAAGAGIVAWGFGVVYEKVVTPAAKVLGIAGVTLDPELTEGLIAVAILLFIVAVFILVLSYGLSWIRGRGMQGRVSRLENDVAELKGQNRNETEGHQ